VNFKHRNYQSTQAFSTSVRASVAQYLCREQSLTQLAVQTSFSTGSNVLRSLTVAWIKWAFKRVYKTHTKVLSLFQHAAGMKVIKYQGRGKAASKPSIKQKFTML